MRASTSIEQDIRQWARSKVGNVVIENGIWVLWIVIAMAVLIFLLNGPLDGLLQDAVTCIKDPTVQDACVRDGK